MRLHIVAAGNSDGADLDRMRMEPDFRKATLNMMLCFAAAESVRKQVPELIIASAVLGSSLGELAVTQEFLGTLGTLGIARPLLFQSSLHNATLGFLAIRLGITGPSVSVSNRHFTGENCLETASLLLGAGASSCLVFGVDSRVPALEPALHTQLPAGVELGSGATALLLASDETVRALKLASLAIIEAVDYSRDCSNDEFGTPWASPYYDSDALERIARVLPKHVGQLRLLKPDGRSSVIRFADGRFAAVSDSLERSNGN